MSLKIISGGQTGVDRAALDMARALDIPHGGWCPRGRKAEDGVIDACYQLDETESASYGQRTVRNIARSDATLVIVRSREDIFGGTKLTLDTIERERKPFYIVTLNDHYKLGTFGFWRENLKIQTLNVAGPRESKCPGIYSAAFDFLVLVIRERA